MICPNAASGLNDGYPPQIIAAAHGDILASVVLVLSGSASRAQDACAGASALRGFNAVVMRIVKRVAQITEASNNSDELEKGEPVQDVESLPPFLTNPHEIPPAIRMCVRGRSTPGITCVQASAPDGGQADQRSAAKRRTV